MGKAFVCMPEKHRLISVQRYVNLFTSHLPRFSTLKSLSNLILLLYTSHDYKMVFLFSYQPSVSKVFGFDSFFCYNVFDSYESGSSCLFFQYFSGY